MCEVSVDTVREEKSHREKKSWGISRAGRKEDTDAAVSRRYEHKCHKLPEMTFDYYSILLPQLTNAEMSQPRRLSSHLHAGDSFRTKALPIKPQQRFDIQK